MVSYGICSNCIPFDQRRRYVPCRPRKDLILLMKIALLLPSCETDTECRSGTTGKQQGEYHIPRQKLLIMCFLKEKKVHTHLCLLTFALRCLALKSSGESIGFRLEYFAYVTAAKSGPGSKTNQKPPTTCRTTEVPTTNHHFYCIREKGRVLWN